MISFPKKVITETWKKTRMTRKHKILTTLQMGFFKRYSSLLVCRTKVGVTELVHSTIYKKFYTTWRSFTLVILLGSKEFVAFFLACSTQTRFVILFSEEAESGHWVPIGPTPHQRSHPFHGTPGKFSCNGALSRHIETFTHANMTSDGSP